ncbi:efflux transporter outer membrane subunit [Gimesia sp.]|uniref:efflux transporter outer membrane subunit n=1 Tax=Gimesia sp. TaxID=2024833 RepID=UPI0032ED6EB0
MFCCGCGLSEWARQGLRVGPDYCPPTVAIAPEWIDSGNKHVLPLPNEHPDWWNTLQDPMVNELIRFAHGQNLSLRQAGTRVMQARATRAIAMGQFFPQVQQGFGTSNRIQQSRNVALAAPLQSFDQWETGFNASWELDLWGKLRRGIESADARLEASIYDYDAVLVSVIAEVVSAYIEIRTFERRLDIARKNVEIQESSLELSSNRFLEGKTSQVGVYLAESNLNATKATIPPLQTGLRQAKNRLCVLLGIPPTDLSPLISPGIGLPTVSSDIAVGIPADLLRRRPDVRQAERLLAAQSEQIGIATADLYPTISITGEIFLASEEFSDLFQSSSTAGSVGPSFRWNILNYGRIVNNVALQDARFQELLANYQNTVLIANREVEDALIAFLKSQEEVEYLQATVDDLNESLNLLLINFEEGSIDFSPVFVLQGTLRATQDQLAAAQGQVLQNMISVYRALGGGWELKNTEYQTTTVPIIEAPEENSKILPPFPLPEVDETMSNDSSYEVKDDQMLEMQETATPEGRWEIGKVTILTSDRQPSTTRHEDRDE